MTQDKRRDNKFLSNLGLKAVSTVKGIETDRDNSKSVVSKMKTKS